jgi:hypothetical protein
MTELTYYRRRQDVFDQSDCANLRRYRTRRSALYYSSSDPRDPAKELEVQIQTWK